MTVHAKRSAARWLIFTVLLVLADQAAKWLAVGFLKDRSAGVRLIPGVFQLLYVENTGAAFGLLGGRYLLFVIFAALITAACGCVYAASPAAAHYRPIRIVCCLLAAGALGNMIDRILHQYVIDFLYFSLIDFPVFNIADIYVCAGAAFLVIMMLSVYKDDDFHWIKPFFKPGKKHDD